MSKVTRRWFDGDINALLTGLEGDALGFSAAIDSLQWGLTGAQQDIDALEECCTGAVQDINGLSGTVWNLYTDIHVDRLPASGISFDPITGISATDVQDAISQIEQRIDGLTGIGNTGLQGATGIQGAQGDTGSQGETGAQGFTGAEGITGLIGPTGLQGSQGDTGSQGETGAQGYTGAQGSQGYTGLMGPTGPGVIDDMVVAADCVETVYNETGTSEYQPITGLESSITLNGPARVLNMLTADFYSLGADHDITFLVNCGGVTGEWTEYSTSNPQSSTFHLTTDDLPIGTHDIDVFWKIPAARADVLTKACLSAVALDGAQGPTGAQGYTGTRGAVGPTGAYGGPPGETGVEGAQGETGAVGATGPGLATFDTFEKILPLEGWKLNGVVEGWSYGALGDILTYDDVGDKAEAVIRVPHEWDGIADMNMHAGILAGATGTAEAAMRLSYKGFDNGDDMSSLGALTTSTQTWSGASTVNEFHIMTFPVLASEASNKDYLFLRLEKVAGTPDMVEIGVASTEFELPVGVGIGPTGFQGVTGAQGLTGLGVTGMVGDTGLPGPTGLQGATGKFLPWGATGLAGPTGVEGAQGVTGAQGKGTTGLQGDTGLPGSQGATGDQGLTGLGVTGVGSTGLAGATGLPGAQGDQGETGAVGDQGETGEQGAQGETGPVGKGETGLQGLQGIQGSTGAQGVTGAGVMGATGTGTFSDTELYGQVSRYQAGGDTGIEVWCVSASTTYAKQSWSKLGTTLTINNTAHGHADGDRVIIRNSNVEYLATTIVTHTADAFNVTTDNTGAASGTDCSYSLGFNFSHVGSPSRTGGVLTAPSGPHADVQLISIRIRTGSRNGNTYELEVPASAINGAGANTGAGDIYIPSTSVRNDPGSSGGPLGAIGHTLASRSSGSWTKFMLGSLGSASLSRYIILHF